VLAVLAAGDLAFVLTGSCGLALWMTGHQRSTAVVATVFAVATLGTAVVMAQGFGMLGLAVTMAVGIVGQNIVLLLLARRRLGIWTHSYLRPRGVADAVASVVRARPATAVAAISGSGSVTR
jgi:O-antigen/teichoic acid export membrane protein